MLKKIIVKSNIICIRQTWYIYEVDDPVFAISIAENLPHQWSFTHVESKSLFVFMDIIFQLNQAKLIKLAKLK